MNRYKVIEAQTADNLTQQINDLAASGWQLVGPAQVGIGSGLQSDLYVATLVLPPSSTGSPD